MIFLENHHFLITQYLPTIYFYQKSQYHLQHLLGMVKNGCRKKYKFLDKIRHFIIAKVILYGSV
jgi:hypothetical protein